MIDKQSVIQERMTEIMMPRIQAMTQEFAREGAEATPPPAPPAP